MFTKKGQGSLEYLLILGGAILVAVIIIAAITMLPQNNPAEANAIAASCQTAVNEQICENVSLSAGSKLTVSAVCPGAGGALTPCCFDSTAQAGKQCSINPTLK